MKALLMVISVVLFAGAAALVFMTAVAFAGHLLGNVVNYRLAIKKVVNK
jgi:hypothetical protein